MVKNRLRIVRRAKRKTQQEVASYIGISQNTYSYWESGKSKIDNESLLKLSAYFNVSADFLIGKSYRVTVKPDEWEPSIYHDYKMASDEEKIYMEYRYGKIMYYDSEFEKEKSPLTSSELSEKEVVFHRDGQNMMVILNAEQWKMFNFWVDSNIPEDKKD